MPLLRVNLRPLARPVVGIVLGMIVPAVLAVAPPGAAAAPLGPDRAASSAVRDPNAQLPNALVEAVNGGDRHRARELATRAVVRQLFQVHRAHGTFSKVRGCEITGPLRATARARVRTVSCVSMIDYHDAGRHAAVLSWKDQEPRIVSRVEFADGVRAG